MRPVNLLPEEYRPRRATGETKGGAYVVLGVLGTLLVMLLGFALVTNQVNSRKTEIAKAKTEADAAEAKAQSQGGFADFRKVKEEREGSIRTLASGRFDWERMLREVGLVMPKGMWLVDMTASASGDASSLATGGSTPPSGGSSSSSSPPASGGGAAGAQQEPASPSVKLMGCSETQDDVATLMVRLRKLYRATDVKLGESTEEADSASGGATSGGSTGTTATGSEGCGKGRFKFDVTVTFSAALPPTSDTKRVPASLGGGS